MVNRASERDSQAEFEISGAGIATGAPAGSVRLPSSAASGPPEIGVGGSADSAIFLEKMAPSHRMDTGVARVRAAIEAGRADGSLNQSEADWLRYVVDGLW